MNESWSKVDTRPVKSTVNTTLSGSRVVNKSSSVGSEMFTALVDSASIKVALSYSIVIVDSLHYVELRLVVEFEDVGWCTTKVLL